MGRTREGEWYGMGWDGCERMPHLHESVSPGEKKKKDKMLGKEREREGMRGRAEREMRWMRWGGRREERAHHLSGTTVSL